jgi:hypothetical protein
MIKGGKIGRPLRARRFDRERSVVTRKCSTLGGLVIVRDVQSQLE